jgi:ComF family protein
MMRFIETILDAILPLRARSVRVKELLPEDIPLAPSVHELLGIRITTLTEYGDKTVADLIQSLKYDGSSRAATLLAEALAEYLTEEIASMRQFTQKKILIVPVPLHSSRKRERGFNQMESILKRLPADLLPYMEVGALERTRPTKQQTRLSRSERLSNVAGAFAVRDENAVRGSMVYVIDDVTTTGATLANAATALRRAGAEVTPIALARA